MEVELKLPFPTPLFRRSRAGLGESLNKESICECVASLYNTIPDELLLLGQFDRVRVFVCPAKKEGKELLLVFFSGLLPRKRTDASLQKNATSTLRGTFFTSSTESFFKRSKIHHKLCTAKKATIHIIKYITQPWHSQTFLPVSTQAS